MPAVVRVRRADHDLEIGVEFPEFYDRFEAIHPGRHAHIDECHGIRLAFIERASYQLDALLALICGLHRETPMSAGQKSLRRKAVLPLHLACFCLSGAAQNFTKTIVDTAIVVNDEDAPVPLIVGRVRKLLSFCHMPNSSKGVAYRILSSYDRFSLVLLPS